MACDSRGTEFSDANSRWWATHPPKICTQSDPPPFRTQRFRPISAHFASTVRAGKNVQLALIGSRLHIFQQAIDEPCTLTALEIILW